MRKRSAANSAASSPPVPARISRMAFFSSAASLGNNIFFTVCSSAGRRFLSSAASSSAIAFMSGSAASASVSLRSCSALRQALTASTSGPNSAYSFDAATNFCESREPPERAACSSAWRATTWSSFCNSDTGSALQRVGELVERHFALLLRIQILHLRHTLGELVVADDDGSTRIELIGALHAALHVAAIILLHRDTGTAQRARDTQRLGLGDGPQRRNHHRPRQWLGLIREHHQPLDAAGPADAGGRRPAQLGYQFVIAAATENGALSADVRGHELESRVRVIVEAAHQSRIDLERHARRRQAVLHRLEEILAGLVQVIGEARRIGVDGLVILVLAVEDTQRIALQPVSRIRRELRAVPGIIVNQHLAIGGAAFRIAERIDFQHTALEETQSIEDVGRHRDHFDVGGRLGRAQHLEVDLVELALATLLRPLVTEHRPGSENLER